MNLKRPVLTANPQVGGPLSRIRSRLSQLRHAPSSLKILLVLNDMESTSDSLAAIDLARALADEYTVFLCNAQPQNCDPTMVARVDNRVIFLEGTLGPSPWSAVAEQSGRPEAGRRREILKELIRFHQIDLIHSRAWPADCLVFSLIDDVRTPWVIDLAGIRDAVADCDSAAPETRQQADAILATVRGVFYEHETDFIRLEHESIHLPAGKARWLIDRGSSIDRRAARCAEGYLEACKLLSFQLGEQTPNPGMAETPSIPSRRGA